MHWTHWVLYLMVLPWNLLVGWPVVLLIRLFWGGGLKWETPPPYDRSKGGGGGPCLTCQIKPNTFPVTPGRWPKGWYLRSGTDRPWGGTTLGHAIFYGPHGRVSGEGFGDPRLDLWTRTQAHEHIHVEQAEAASVGSFFVGLAAGIVLWLLGHVEAGAVLFLVVWTTGYLVMGVSGWLTALLRGEEAYWGSTHEESARAQDDRLAVR